MKATIYKQSKSSTQSGKANTKHWIIAFVNDGSRNIEPIMGWTSSSDMMQEVTMQFDSLSMAKEFAEKHKIEYEVIEPKEKKLIIKSYAENFK